MVASFGMSEKVGFINYNSMMKDAFTKPFSDQTARDIDVEVKNIINEAYAKTKEIVIQNKDKIAELAELLLKKETITQNDAEKVLGARKWKVPKEYDDFLDLSWRCIFIFIYIFS